MCACCGKRELCRECGFGEISGRAHGVVGVLLVKTESEKLGSNWWIHPERKGVVGGELVMSRPRVMTGMTSFFSV